LRFRLASKPAGVGLHSIRERIESLGGNIQIESMPECGTRLIAHVPVSPEQSQDDRRK
jgi:signal transduction histidine kinase